jgi:hypothetical protein
MAGRPRTSERLAAGIFALGCLGMCGGAGSLGLALGFAAYGVGWVIAMEIEDRLARPSARLIGLRAAPTAASLPRARVRTPSPRRDRGGHRRTR